MGFLCVCEEDGHRQREIVSFVCTCVCMCVLAVFVSSKRIPPQTTKSLLVLSLAFLVLSFPLSIFLNCNSQHLSSFSFLSFLSFLSCFFFILVFILTKA